MMDPFSESVQRQLQPLLCHPAVFRERSRCNHRHNFDFDHHNFGHLQHFAFVWLYLFFPPQQSSEPWQVVEEKLVAKTSLGVELEDHHIGPQRKTGFDYEFQLLAWKSVVTPRLEVRAEYTNCSEARDWTREENYTAAEIRVNR